MVYSIQWYIAYSGIGISSSAVVINNLGGGGLLRNCNNVCILFPNLQHEFLSQSSEYIGILYQLVHRTQEAVRQMDNQSYKRLQKMLIHGTSSIEEDDKEEEIESEPPR